MKNGLSALCALVFSLLITEPVHAENGRQQSLNIGVVPYLSARILVGSYEPMRKYLEQVLGIPVKIFTAPSFKQFQTNTEHGDFDLVATPAHFARILQKDQNFRPLVRYAKGGRGLIMVAKDGGIKDLEGLKGKTIAVPFRISLAAIICVTALQEHGMNNGKEITLAEYPSFESALLAVKNGEAAAAVSAPGALVQLKPELRDSVTPVLDTGEYINLIYLANPKMESRFTDMLHKALVKFGNSPDGRKFFEGTGFGEFLPVTDHDMKSLDKYVANTRKLLAEDKSD